MRATSFLAPLFLAATTLAQAVEEGIAPSSPPPEGCETTVDGNFTIGVLNGFHSSKRETAEQAADGALYCTLKDGILHDQYGRTGSVVANRQFQFDGPPQAGAIYTGGFSVCKNNSLAIGGTTRWWRCMSGEFGNLYDEYIGGQCHEIRIQAGLPESPSSSQIMDATSTLRTSDFSEGSTTSSATATGSSQPSNATGSTTSRSSPTSSPEASSSGTSSGSPVVAAAPPAETNSATSMQIASVTGIALLVMHAALLMS